MRKWIAFIGLLGLFVQAEWALPDVTEGQCNNPQSSEVEKIVQNKALLNDLLDRIIADAALRQRMLQKLSLFAKSHPQVRLEVQKMFTDRQAISRQGERMPEILVKFKTEVSADQVQALVTELGHQEVKVIHQLNIHVYRVPSAGSVDEIIARIQKKPFVEYAEPNQTYSIPE